MVSGRKEGPLQLDAVAVVVANVVDGDVVDGEVRRVEVPRDLVLDGRVHVVFVAALHEGDDVLLVLDVLVSEPFQLDLDGADSTPWTSSTSVVSASLSSSRLASPSSFESTGVAGSNSYVFVTPRMVTSMLFSFMLSPFSRGGVGGVIRHHPPPLQVLSAAVLRDVQLSELTLQVVDRVGDAVGIAVPGHQVRGGVEAL
jgi:hypothetical protein